MNLKSRLILEDYRKQREGFVKLGDVAHQMLADIAKELGLTVLAVEHRVKEEKSLAGKLERKGDGYNTLEDITDILGHTSINTTRLYIVTTAIEHRRKMENMRLII